MSDLTATNCGCNNSCECRNNGMMGGSCIWIILLLFFCNGNNGCGNGILGGNSCNNGCNNGCDNNGCDWIIWIILLSCFCGNGSGLFGGNSCNNGCC